jgi:hypothetical protein
MTILNSPGIFVRLENAGKPSKSTKAKRSKERKIINRLGRLDDLLNAARVTPKALRMSRLAAIYQRIGCTQIAAKIRAEENL